MYMVMADTIHVDDDTPKVPHPVMDALMSPQAKRYWKMATTTASTQESGSDSEMASAKHQ
jgi:hypothetical protein